MKIKHRVPPNWQPKNDPISDRYMAEVDQATNKLERAYRRAEARLASAELRLAKAHTERPRDVHVAAELVELRRQELLAIARLMTGSGVGSAHRSRSAHRPIPGMSTL